MHFLDNLHTHTLRCRDRTWHSMSCLNDNSIAQLSLHRCHRYNIIRLSYNRYTDYLSQGPRKYTRTSRHSRRSHSLRRDTY